VIDPISAERAFLGIMLLEEREVPGAGELPIESVFLSSHRTILGVMRTMYAKDGAVNLVTLASELQRLGLEATVGGMGYVASLTDGLPRGTDVAPYVDIIKEAARARRIQVLCDRAGERLAAGERTSWAASRKRPLHSRPQITRYGPNTSGNTSCPPGTR